MDLSRVLLILSVFAVATATKHESGSTRAPCSTHTEGAGSYQTYEAVSNITHGIYIEFHVMAASDALLLLTQDGDTFYTYFEVTIGSANNTISSVRNDMAGADIVRYSTPGILDAASYRSFWLRYLGGIIEVGNTGNDVPFLYYNVGDYDLNTVGFSSWVGTTAQWIVHADIGDETFTTNNYLYTHYTAASDTTGTVRLDFSLRTTSDAAILLSRYPFPAHNTPVYEVLLGSTSNGTASLHTSVRLLQGEGPEYGSILTPGIVNNAIFNCFWLEATTTGLISVGISGNAAPFFRYQVTTSPITVAYYSFGSSYVYEADWRTPCACAALTMYRLVALLVFALVPALASQGRNDTRVCLTQHTMGYGPVTYQDVPLVTHGMQLNFMVMTVSDAYLLITTDGDTNLPYYEIVIGGVGNTISSIRNVMAGPDIVRVATPNILSGTTYRSFWFRYLGGVIEVGEEGNSSPFLYYNTGLTGINTIGFSSWLGTSASWILALPTGQESFTTQNYNYNHFTMAADVDGSVHMQFSVRTGSDAIVQFSRYASPTPNMNVYEVIIGTTNDGASQMHTSVRRVINGPELGYQLTPNVVSALNFTCLWIDIATSGLISVGQEGSTVPFYTYQDVNTPLHVAYYGLSSQYNIQADWMVPCGCSAGS